MSAATQYQLFSEELFRRMERDGFQKKSRSTAQKKQGTHALRLTLYTNKMRSGDAIRQTYIIGQKYPEIDAVIYYLTNEYFSSKWATGRVWLCTLMPGAAKTCGLPNALAPNGYTHYLDDGTDIPRLAQEVYDNIVRYAYPFWEAYHSPQAVLAGLEEGRPELKAWAVFGSDLFRLACYLLFREKEKALAFCEQRMAAARQDGGVRTSLTPEIRLRAAQLTYGPDGGLLVPPRPADAKVR